MPSSESTPDVRTQRRGTSRLRKWLGPLAPAGLVVNVAASAVAALLLASLNVSGLGTVAGVLLIALVTAYLQTPGVSPSGQWIRIGIGAVAAVVISVVGLTLPELALGHSLTNDAKGSTYPVTKTDPTTTALPPQPQPQPQPQPRKLPDIAVSPEVVECGEAEVGSSAECLELTVRSTGTAPLRITHVDPPAPAFSVDIADCVGRTLATGETCLIKSTFTPSAAGPHETEIVIHQNIPSPDTGTVVQLTGQAVEIGGPSSATPLSEIPDPEGRGE